MRVLGRPVTAHMLERARLLRHTHTRAERLLWAHLRRGRLDGLRFRRQQAIGRYIVDFYCHEARLIVELDGAHHAGPEQRAQDDLRDADMAALGVRVLRLSNVEVLTHLKAVLERIHRHTRESGSAPGRCP